MCIIYYIIIYYDYCSPEAMIVAMYISNPVIFTSDILSHPPKVDAKTVSIDR